MNYITILFFIVLLQSCTTISKTQPVMAYLQPIHTTTSGFSEQNFTPVELIDNDGNMYITYWDVEKYKKSEFNLSILECRNKIKSNRLFNKSVEVSEIKTEDIKPLLFKIFNSCLLNKYYVHKYSDAFSPEKYKLTITRPISSSGEYMPVGAKYYLAKKGTKYKDVLLVVKDCVIVINKTDGQGVHEIHTGGYSHVSIENYANNITSCLRENNFILTPLNPKEPNKAVKLMREKDTHLDQANSAPGHLP